MKLKHIVTGAAAAIALATAAFAQDGEPVKVAFVYVGPKDDGGWSQQHHLMALEMVEHFGEQVEFSYLESVPEAESERVFTQLALAGNDIIFATSFGYMDPMLAAAEKFPDVKFEHATGYKTADNMANYAARFYEGRAIMGHIAGRMTETDRIGYIASFPVPEVLRGMSSAYIHAKKANPDVEMTVVWLGTWFDPPRESDATQAMIDQGIDVILAQTAAFVDHRRLGALLHRAGAGGDRRDLGDRRHLGRDRRGHGRHRRVLRSDAGRGAGRGAGADGLHRVGRIPPVHRADQQAGRLGLAGRRRSRR